jgi:hypothetical protein
MFGFSIFCGVPIGTERKIAAKAKFFVEPIGETTKLLRSEIFCGADRRNNKIAAKRNFLWSADRHGTKNCCESEIFCGVFVRVRLIWIFIRNDIRIMVKPSSDIRHAIMHAYNLLIAGSAVSTIQIIKTISPISTLPVFVIPEEVSPKVILSRYNLWIRGGLILTNDQNIIRVAEFFPEFSAYDFELLKLSKNDKIITSQQHTVQENSNPECKKTKPNIVTQKKLKIAAQKKPNFASSPIIRNSVRERKQSKMPDNENTETICVDIISTQAHQEEKKRDERMEELNFGVEIPNHLMAFMAMKKAYILIHDDIQAGCMEIDDINQDFVENYAILGAMEDSEELSLLSNDNLEQENRTFQDMKNSLLENTFKKDLMR